MTRPRPFDYDFGSWRQELKRHELCFIEYLAHLLYPSICNILTPQKPE